MLILSLASVARDPVGLQGRIAADDPMWDEVGLALEEPLRVDLEARMVGDGVLVRGEMETRLAADCRRCLTPAPVSIRETVHLLYEPLSGDEEAELSGEVYPLPERGDELDVTEALREQLVLLAPNFVVCSETCRGLCPQCGEELNRTTCDCVPDEGPGPWDALKNIKFD
ncbi:MAG: DUF177 domain-containing protein [Gemmatimonadota bacterium]